MQKERTPTMAKDTTKAAAEPDASEVPAGPETDPSRIAEADYPPVEDVDVTEYPDALVYGERYCGCGAIGRWRGRAEAVAPFADAFDSHHPDGQTTDNGRKHSAATFEQAVAARPAGSNKPDKE